MAVDKHLPPVQWAQRKDKLYITINVEDCRKPTIKLEPNSIYFDGVGNKDMYHYEVKMDLCNEIDPEKSKYAVQSRHITFVIYKKESGPFWPRLLKDKTKVHWLKTDFDKWKDEDDSDCDDTKDRDFEDMMKNMGNYAGSNDQLVNDDDDSDDEEMPDLE